MKSLPVIVASALLCVVALSGCSDDTTDVGSSSGAGVGVETSVDSDVAEPTLMTSGNEPDWLVVEGGVYVGDDATEYKGNIYCPAPSGNPNDGTYPVYLDETVTVEPVNGDLVYTFYGQVPPGLILPYDGSWVVAIFDEPGATRYRITSEMVNPDYIEMYRSDPATVTTCW